MTGDPSCDLVLLTYRFPDLTEQLLRSLVEQDGTARHWCQVVWVDNGSPDDERQRVRAALAASGFAWREVLQPANYGFPRSMNDGIEACTAPLVLLANNDTRLIGPALSTMRAQLLLHDLDIVNPMSNNRSRPDWKLHLHGKVPQPVIDALAPLRERDDDAGAAAWLREHCADRVALTYDLSFFFTMFRRDVFSKLGFLDERYGMGFGEDDQFCWRAAAACLRVGVALGAFVSHEHRGTWGRTLSKTQLRERYEESVEHHHHWRAAGSPIYVGRPARTS